jgi:hypothetical protein
MTATKIENLGQLRELAGRDGGLDCFILLNGGLRSSKHIRTVDGCTKGKVFYVFNLIDDSECYLTAEEIVDPGMTMIGEAMSKGALFAED